MYGSDEADPPADPPTDGAWGEPLTDGSVEIEEREQEIALSDATANRHFLLWVTRLPWTARTVSTERWSPTRGCPSDYERREPEPLTPISRRSVRSDGRPQYWYARSLRWRSIASPTSRSQRSG